MSPFSKNCQTEYCSGERGGLVYYIRRKKEK